MGGYGSSSGRDKTNNHKYTDTGGHVVKDKDAIEVGEQLIDEGHRVAFLQEHPQDKWKSRPDLLVDDNMLIEVKTLTSERVDQVYKKIKFGFLQTKAEIGRRGNPAGIIEKVHIRIKNEELAMQGYAIAKKRNYISGIVEFNINGKFIQLT